MTESNSGFQLSRFVSAQDQYGTYDQALAEITKGHKESHWMWFIFPQIAGLGTSDMATLYAVKSLDEAKAYLDHAVLGPRLIECVEALLSVQGETVEEIFGDIDARKLKSSMTLFMRANPSEPRFQDVLSDFFNGEPDPATDALLQ